MKKTTLTLLASAALAATTFASAGPGPWANSTWYPGSLDGKYQAAVYGENISGVVGFALSSGAPTTATTSTLNMTNGSSQSTLTVNPFQNYYAIFVEGRTYTGIALANINNDNSSITGTLIGAQPDYTLDSFTLKIKQPAITNITPTVIVIGKTNITTVTTTYVTNIIPGPPPVEQISEVVESNTATLDLLSTNYTTNVTASPTLDSDYKAFNPLPLINRGLNGGFQAKITANTATFTFVGKGNLSTPSQTQVININRDNLSFPGDIIGTQVQTDTIPFMINGLRVSFTTSP